MMQRQQRLLISHESLMQSSKLWISEIELDFGYCRILKKIILLQITSTKSYLPTNFTRPNETESFYVFYFSGRFAKYVILERAGCNTFNIAQNKFLFSLRDGWLMFTIRKEVACHVFALRRCWKRGASVLSLVYPAHPPCRPEFVHPGIAILSLQLIYLRPLETKQWWYAVIQSVRFHFLPGVMRRDTGHVRNIPD